MIITEEFPCINHRLQNAPIVAFFLSPNSLKVIFMYTIINNLSTLNFKFLRIETRSYFTPSNITLIYIAKWRDNKCEASTIFQYYQLNFLQSKVKKACTCKLVSDSLQKCAADRENRTALHTKTHHSSVELWRAAAQCPQLPHRRCRAGCWCAACCSQSSPGTEDIGRESLYIHKCKGFSHWRSLESTRGSSNL